MVLHGREQDPGCPEDCLELDFLYGIPSPSVENEIPENQGQHRDDRQS
jgi:hypothetical protein